MNPRKWLPCRSANQREPAGKSHKRHVWLVNVNMNICLAVAFHTFTTSNPLRRFELELGPLASPL